MTFLVLAPPRSMTAWLANLLTDGVAVCHHDVLVDGGLERMKAIAGDDVGFAESAGLAVPSALLKAFPCAPIVVVRSQPDQVARSLGRLGLDGDGFIRAVAPQITRALEMLKDRALIIPREDVLARAAEISRHLTGREPSPARLALLRAMRVTKVNPLHGDRTALRELIRSER